MMEAEDIKRVCLEVRQSAIPRFQKELYFEKKYPDFKEAYPKLFKACLDPDFPLLDHLDYMLRVMTQMEKEKLGVEDADRQVYDTLRERYVTPVIQGKD